MANIYMPPCSRTGASPINSAVVVSKELATRLGEKATTSPSWLLLLRG